ncbi:accessory Sec-dependent serine-rich glycoprotein adhesin, partial [Lactobacillus salivarius]|nr:accessory Sec-dependent serine-rich glycoprotein adhesin [Ligilactobacillus salivarius]
MKFKRNRRNFIEFENDRKTHVKLYKSGKQWVSSLISSIGLIRIFKGKLDKNSVNTQVVDFENNNKEDKLKSDGITAVLKGVAAVGAITGGTALTNTALADTRQVDDTANLVNQDTVNLSSGSGSNSTSESTSISLSENTTTSNSQSVTATSENESSTTLSESKTESESIKQSNSDSESLSNSTNSQSSQSVSSTESIASSNSITNSNNQSSAKTAFENLLNQAADFENSDTYKNANDDYKVALKAAVAAYSSALQSNSLSDDDYAYGVEQLSALITEMKANRSITPQILAMVPSDQALFNPYSTAPGDTGSLVNTDNNLRWIYGDNKVWGKLEGYGSRDSGQSLLMAKNNFTITKKDLGNGKAHWTITFFPKQGLQYDPTYYPKPYGLENARFGFLLTKDFTVVGDVSIRTNVDLNNPSYRMSTNGLNVEVDESNHDVTFSFNPQTDLNYGTGHVGNAYFGQYGSNSYIQETLYISDSTPNQTNTIANKIVPGNSSDTLEANDITARQSSRILTNGSSIDGPSVNNSTFGTAMYMKSWGNSGNSMYASYTISFDTVHSNEVQKNLALGTKNGSFSGVYAIVDSY